MKFGRLFRFQLRVEQKYLVSRLVEALVDFTIEILFLSVLRCSQVLPDIPKSIREPLLQLEHVISIMIRCHFRVAHHNV